MYSAVTTTQINPLIFTYGSLLVITQLGLMTDH